MHEFETTFSDAETLAKVLGFAFIGAIVATMPALVIVLALLLSALAFFALLASYVRFECDFEVSAPKADSAFVEYLAKKQAQRHSAKIAFAMKRAKKQKQVMYAQRQKFAGFEDLLPGFAN